MAKVIAAILVVLVVGAVVYYVGLGTYGDTSSVYSDFAGGQNALPPNTGSSQPASGHIAAPLANYDEQEALTFTQPISALACNVTAVAQNDSYGYGPAYLLNGLSNMGYWYQVGVAYDWGSDGYAPGFHFVYEVFNPDQVSIYPSNGGAGLSDLSGPVNGGDTVLLRLYFSASGQVVMSAKDLRTGATASEAYNAEGAAYFAGSPQMQQWHGFFTGVMTEWYHVSQYYGGEQRVVYATSSYSVSTAYMWVDEFQTHGISQGPSLFWRGTQVFYHGSEQLIPFSSNGATEYSNPFEFVSG